MATTQEKNSSSTIRREEIRWPSSGQVFRQLGLIILIVAVWIGLLVVYLALTGGVGSVFS